jgi:hypothetical protein
MDQTFTSATRRLGIWTAAGTVGLDIAYAITLVAGFLSLTSPDQPIGDPLFSILEILIILMMPVMVALMIALFAWASPERKVYAMLAVVFMALVAGLTCSLHFVILTIGHRPEFTGSTWMPLVLSFKWPSVAYALDILAWDLFFPLSVLSAAPLFSGSRLAASIRLLMIVSGVLALGGLGGAFAGDMQLRNIGIVGYTVVFPVAAILLLGLFYRSRIPSQRVDQPEE